MCSAVARDTIMPIPPRRKELIAATAGALVESYDWAIYSTLAVYFSAQLFSGANPTVKLLLALATFAGGYLVRPIGSVLIGRLADTRGRRFALIFGISLTTAMMILIAVVPTYDRIGMWSTVITVAARMVQGVVSGGEKSTGASYITETAPTHRRYSYAAIAYGGDICGGILGFSVTATLLAAFGTDGMTHGGWRVAFAFGALLGATSLWIRCYAQESEVFVTHIATRANSPAPWPLLHGNSRSLLAVFLLVIGGTTSYTFGVYYLPQYAWRDLGIISAGSSDALINIALVIMLVAMLASGRLADRFGPLVITRIGTSLVALATVPLVEALSHRLLPFVVFAPLYLACVAVAVGISNVFNCQVFPPEIRALAMGIANTVAVAIFGGTLPLVATALGANRLSWLLPWLVATASVIAFCGSLLLAPRHNQVHPDTPPGSVNSSV